MGSVLRCTGRAEQCRPSGEDQGALVELCTGSLRRKGWWLCVGSDIIGSPREGWGLQDRTEGHKQRWVLGYPELEKRGLWG